MSDENANPCCPTHEHQCPTLPCPHTMVKCLTRVKDRHDPSRMGVVITGQVQKDYRKGFTGHVAGSGWAGYTKYTVVDAQGAGYSFESVDQLLVNWSVVREFDVETQFL